MTDETWRCFVAVPIGETLRVDLRTAEDGWPDVEGVRWTDPDGWHVTLAFLGSIDATSVPGVVERLVAVAEKHEGLSLRSGGLGAFPSLARARVAWYGIDDEQGRLARLAVDVAAALDLGAPRPYRQHVTLARARRRPVDVRPWLESASAPEGVLAVSRLELMRSHVGEGPTRYETLATIPLRVPVHV